MRRSPATLLALGAVWWTVNPSPGAEVLFTTSSLETYAGAPVEIRVIIKNATDHEPPRFPRIDGADVKALQRDTPEQSVSEKAGRQETRLIYTYAVTPRKAGELTVPPIRVVADGKSFSSAPIKIVAKKSEAGDLLYVRMVGERHSVYVGEPVDATLEVWLKPYEAANIWMDAEDLWLHAIDENTSTWGAFAQNLEGETRSISYPADARPDAHGGEQHYFVYTLKRRIWPDRPGIFDAPEVNVVANYPLRVRHDPVTRVGCPHEIVESRPISAKVENQGILVKAVPTKGRPESFRGAVGRYAMIVAATPTEVSVGDPITLTFTIRGTGRMDLLQAPKLAEQEMLTADFRVPDHELPGTVSGTVKTFTEIIRAKHDGVTQVPPIELSYFDPQLERFVRLRSDPIPLLVKEPSRLPVGKVAGGTEVPVGQKPLPQVESGILANYADLEELLCDHSSSLGWVTWAPAVSGPILYVACLLFRRHRDRLAGDSGFRRRRLAHRTAMQALGRAPGGDATAPSESLVAAAVTGYVADRCNVPPASVTRDEAIKKLRSRNMPDTLIDEVDELLSECEGAQYGAAGAVESHHTKERARRCIDELERRGF
jgi:hypothetical protein